MGENLKTIETLDTRPFKKFIMTIGELPTSFIESMTYYELLSWFCDYLQNTVIPTVNNNAEAVEELQNLFIELKNFVDNYFNNLDVQTEIDNKLDEMYANGQLDLLFTKYVSNYVSATNTRIDNLEEKVNSLNDLTPTVVNSTSAMTDQTKIYLNTADGYWYYYNGTQFVQGGLYNSDADISLMKWYLNDVATDGYNQINPFTSMQGSIATADGTYWAADPDFWLTDYIPLDLIKIGDRGNEWNFGAISYKEEPFQFYKVLFFDSEKVKTHAITTRNNRIVIGKSTVADISNFAYMRIQFRIDEIPFNERYYVTLSETDAPNDKYGSLNLSTLSRFTSVDTKGIAAHGVENTRLSKNLYINNIYNMLNNNLNPFTLTDFAYGTIESTDGASTYNITRLSIPTIIKVPAGTSIILTNGWNLLAFKYSSNGSFQGRMYDTWGDSIYFPFDTFVKFVFKNDVLGNLNSEDDILNLISNITIDKSSSRYEYNGEKIILKNTYNVTHVGLPVYGQDSAYYDGNYITFNANGYYKMYTINGDLIKNTTALDQVSTYAPHANSVCFGNEKYDENDKYPLLYVNAYNTVGLPKGACYVYRLLNNMTTTLQQQILINFTEDPIWNGDGTNVRPYGNFVVDTDNNKLYVYVMIDSLQVTRFFKFNLPTLSQGSVVRLAKDDIEEYFDIEWMYYMQGVTYFNDKIYATCGFSVNDCKLYVVDLKTKKASSIVPLGGFVGEPESAFVYNNELYISSTTSLFRLSF